MSMLGFALGGGGETAEGLKHARLGSDRDPDSLLTLWIHGLTANWHGEYEESVTAFNAASAVVAYCVDMRNT